MSTRKPLFVQQPFCRERKHCQACRQEDPSFRKAWEARYTMPAGWPDCPYGVPFGYVAPPPRPTDPQLQTLFDLPESREGQQTLTKLRIRSEIHLRTCLGCAHYRHTVKMTSGVATVQCAVGKRCCGGTLEPGPVHLGAGVCLDGKW